MRLLERSRIMTVGADLLESIFALLACFREGGRRAVGRLIGHEVTVKEKVVV